MWRKGHHTALNTGALKQILPRSSAILKYSTANYNSMTSTCLRLPTNAIYSSPFKPKRSGYAVKPLSRCYSTQARIQTVSKRTSAGLKTIFTGYKYKKGESFNVFLPVLGIICVGTLAYTFSSWPSKSEQDKANKYNEKLTKRPTDAQAMCADIQALEAVLKKMENSVILKYWQLINAQQTRLRNDLSKSYVRFWDVGFCKVDKIHQNTPWSAVRLTVREIKNVVMSLTKWFSRSCVSLQQARMDSLPFLSFFIVVFLSLHTNKIRSMVKKPKTVLGLFSSSF
ncbi:uncharacterized protein FA14DRAFT_158524 [Meira miltonrushii]|uniref:Uncharacterized protein n=1 Tax=Meira miltonrushii TaxID=1280837 RepID=A0A316V5D3_9BASI|nr:uncharacterized protein FA14DRAFT_158524 [Meira miltonrushii]PWN31711.1 hypothetical protein FA14DRAFT_158524 [Meira miltonrushii]